MNKSQIYVVGETLSTGEVPNYTNSSQPQILEEKTSLVVLRTTQREDAKSR